MNCQQTAKKACKEWFAYQNDFEMEMALRSLKRFDNKSKGGKNIRVVLEIGTAHGASLACWAEVLKPDLAIGIDPRTNPMTEDQQKSYQFLVEKYDLKEIPYISRLQEAHDMLEKLLDGRKVDFLFIDGGHDYSDATHDFYKYLKYMNSPGIVGFHDIFQSDQLADAGHLSGVFWERIKKQYPYDEFHYHSSMGIGFVYV